MEALLASRVKERPDSRLLKTRVLTNLPDSYPCRLVLVICTTAADDLAKGKLSTAELSP